MSEWARNCAYRPFLWRKSCHQNCWVGPRCRDWWTLLRFDITGAWYRTLMRFRLWAVAEGQFYHEGHFTLPWDPT